MPKVSQLALAYPHDCEILQQLRAECADYTYFLNGGYISYYINTTFKPYEHRLVAEWAYGEMPAGYQVHHQNGIRSDNRASNLLVLSPNEHAQHHGALWTTSETRACDCCTKPIRINEARLYRNGNFYCNRTCYNLASRKVSRPNAEELNSLLEQIGNWSAIGRLYGVSDNAVRKWAKQYGLLSSPYGS